MLSVARFFSAFLFLAAPPRGLRGHPPARFERLAGAIMALGAAWGLVLIGLWDVSFMPTWPHRQDALVPAGVCAVATTAGLYRLAALAVIEAAVGKRRWLQWLGLAGTTAGLAAILYHGVRAYPDWPTQLPPAWVWLRPRALYRVLLLTPVWGAWAMLALGQFHRPTPETDPPTRHFAGSVGPLATAGYLLVPLAGSLIYLNFLYPWHFIPPASALLGALAGGALMVRLRGGLRREAVLATNFLTQLFFLAGYLTVK